jgi:hypothetical protein
MRMSTIDKFSLKEISQTFTEGVLEVCEGQAYDKEFELRRRVSLDDYLLMVQKKTGRMVVIHDLGLVSTLELGRKLEMEMPREVVIFAIEAKEMATFSEECTPEVKKAIPKAVEVVFEEVMGDARV